MAIGDRTSGPMASKIQQQTVTLTQQLIDNVIASLGVGGGRNIPAIQAQLTGRLGEEINVTDQLLQGFDPLAPLVEGVDPTKTEGAVDPRLTPTGGAGKGDPTAIDPEQLARQEEELEREVAGAEKKSRRRQALNIVTTPLGILGRTRTRRRRLLGA